MLQVLSVRVYLDNQQQLAQLHLTMVLLVLLLHQAALESQPQQTQQQQQQLQLHQPRLAQLAVQLAHLAAHLAAVHHLVLVLLAAVAVVVVLLLDLLVHQDPQVEDTMVAVTNYHSKNQVTHYLLHQKEESHFFLSVLFVDF